jgi:uncharacterized protein (TIGR02679 family)
VKPDLRAVLQDVPSLGDILAQARKKYVSLSRVAGELPLSSKEVEGARKLGCKVSRSGKLTLEELDRALGETILQRGLVAVLEEIDGGSIQTRLDVNAEIARAYEEYLTTLRAAAVTEEGRSRLDAWIEADSKHLRQEALRDGSVADAVHVAKALDALPGEGEPDMLASFSARLTANAHTFDSDQPAGRLLLRALRPLYPDLELSGALSSADREEVLSAAGILIDDVSSDVLLIGFSASSPTLRAAVDEWLPLRLPLYALDRLPDIHPARGTTAYAVENPSVFRILMERAASLPSESRPALVCTSGHFSLATQRLLEKLASQPVRIRYSGDFDLRGIEIALALRDSYPSVVELWRMAATDYATALLGADIRAPLTESEARRLRRKSREYADLLIRGTAHQETIVDLLWSDIQDQLACLPDDRCSLC